MKAIYVMTIWAVILSSLGCTSTRRMSRKFSEKPAVIYRQFAGVDYANTPIHKEGHVSAGALWESLSYYRLEKTELPEVGEGAVVRLWLTNSDTLTVRAIEDGQVVGSFEIPVRRRGKYLILERKVSMIPIPVLYFSSHEDKTILAPLADGSIGYYSYNDETLWILFFGASQTSNVIHEYQPVEQR